MNKTDINDFNRRLLNFRNDYNDIQADLETEIQARQALEVRVAAETAARQAETVARQALQQRVAQLEQQPPVHGPQPDLIALQQRVTVLEEAQPVAQPLAAPAMNQQAQELIAPATLPVDFCDFVFAPVRLLANNKILLSDETQNHLLIKCGAWLNIPPIGNLKFLKAFRIANPLDFAVERYVRGEQKFQVLVEVVRNIEHSSQGRLNAKDFVFILIENGKIVNYRLEPVEEESWCSIM